MFDFLCCFCNENKSRFAMKKTTVSERADLDFSILTAAIKLCYLKILYA